MNNICNPSSNKTARGFGAMVSAVGLMAGCASIPPPTDQMALSRAAVIEATSAGSNEFAPLQTKSATEKLASAEKAMSEKDYVHARSLAEQAQVDAQLATATTRSVKAQKVADALHEDSRVLREEIDRKSK